MYPPMYPLEPGGPLRTGPSPPAPPRQPLPREIDPGVGPRLVADVQRFIDANGLNAQLDAIEKFVESSAETKAYKVALYALITATVRQVREVPLTNPKLFPLNIVLGEVVTNLPFGTLSNNAEGPVVYIPLSEYDRRAQNQQAMALIDALRLWLADP